MLALLYEGNGIELYEHITRCSHYYLYRDELSILRKHGDEIVSNLLHSIIHLDC